MRLLFFIAIIVFVQKTMAQTTPTFGPEKKVTISGLNFDAMEPFISVDGNTLFFNSLNSGGNTNLYYATKIDDTTFTYAGLVNGTYDPSANHLDAVASIDSLNNFFWTSLRGYPSPMENLHRGVYSSGNVSSITRVYGDFNIYDFNFPFGWLIMDAAINYQGNLLYYCNAKFDFSNTSCVGVPCESKLGVAQKINDSIFLKLPNSNAIFNNINDTINYIIYAPQITKDGLEIYFTRLLKGTTNTEICVSTRSNTITAFTAPSIIHANLGFLPEAASPSSDKQTIYYHQKDGTGVFHIYLRYRNSTITQLDEKKGVANFQVFPNPTTQLLRVELMNSVSPYTISISTILGQEIYTNNNPSEIDMTSFSTGIYYLKFTQNNFSTITKIIKQ